MMWWILAIIAAVIAIRFFFKQSTPSLTGQMPLKVAPIKSEGKEIGFDEDYRNSDDPPHVIRIRQHSPKGVSRRIVNNIAVTGISQPEQRHSAEFFMRGHSRRIILERDPTNEYGPTAIKVVGRWKTPAPENNQLEFRLGWIPHDIAVGIAKSYPEGLLGAKIIVMFQGHKGKNPGLRIEVLGEKSLLYGTETKP